MPKHRSSFGAMVGAGIQFVDEFGIHVVPEVRYTRWMNPTFENLTTTMTQVDEPDWKPRFRLPSRREAFTFDYARGSSSQCCVDAERV